MSDQENQLVAEEIAQTSKSNLAFALLRLPPEKRRDMRSFYAFCRVIDDIADNPKTPREQKAAQLNAWKRGLVSGFENPGAVESETIRVRDKYGIDPELFLEVVRGVEMDLDFAGYETFDELLRYCYRVASAVGLISVKIFGCVRDESNVYALNLGYALQITNILRDVGEDFREDGRIYLPREDRERFGYSDEDLNNGVVNDAFRELMEFEAKRADDFYAKALGGLHAEDKKALRAAEGMRRIYSAILGKMRKGGFGVFERRYRISKLRMLWEVLR
jgi:phytoene synthase